MSDQNKIPRIVIPLALLGWAGGVLATQVDSPLVTVIWVVTLAVVTPVAVFYLLAEQGWSTLARRFRSRQRYNGPWQTIPSAGVSLVSTESLQYAKQRVRLAGALRIATSDDALHLSLLFGRIPILGLFFPDLRIPWQDVTSARPYEAPGWVTPTSQPGALLQATYDPNYKGTFVELTAGQPPVFIQLPAAVLEEHKKRLPAN